MNVREALHDADPARRLPSHLLAEPDEQLLHQILDPRSAASQQVAPSPIRPTRREWKPLIATALVAIVVVAGTILALSVVPTAKRTPALSPTTTVDGDLVAVVDAKLAAAARTTRLDPGLPSQTWSDTAQGAQGGLIDLTGKTLYLAASCRGGGTVTIRIETLLDTTIDCSTSAAIGPINLTAIAAKVKNGIEVDFTASTGRPDYFARAVALREAEATTTSSVDVNGRTLLVYPASGAGGPQALLRGELSENAAGCITVGDTVLVAPSNVVLLSDGSLRIGGARLTTGTAVGLGGGFARGVPSGSPCRAASGDYFVLGDYPQPQ